MDDLLVVARELVVHWRVGLATVVAIPIAMFLAVTLSWFSGRDGVVLVVIAIGAGLAWEMSAHRRPPAVERETQAQTRR